MSSDLSHPVQIRQQPEDIQGRFVRVKVDRASDPMWHYRLAVPNVVKMRPQEGLEAPSTEDPLRSLGLFYREDLEADLEVLGVHLEREIDPCFWLEVFLEFNGLRVASMKRLPGSGGIVGDAVVEWSVAGKPYAGRFVAMKFGYRLFVVCCRSDRETYEKIADDFFVTLTQFGVIDTSPGLCAEQVQKVGAPLPLPWHLFLPASWEVALNQREGEQPGFQASMSSPSRELLSVTSLSAFPGAPEIPRPPLPSPDSYFGRCAVSVMPASLLPTPESAESVIIETFLGAGLELERTQFEDDLPMGIFDATRLLVTRARLSGQGGLELRARIAHKDGLWLLCGVVSPLREVNPFAWMQNRRSLDLVVGAFEPKSG